MADFLLDDRGRPIHVCGYAGLFDTPIVIDGQTEEFARGAFQPSLKFGADVRATINHKRDATWARVRDGSLKLWEDAVGLAFSANLPATPYGRGQARAVADGLIGASVLFRSFKTEKTTSGCIIQAATITDICLCTAPAYPTATWLVPFECMKNATDHALALRRRLIGGQLKAMREARDHVTHPSVAPSRAEQAVKAHHEANLRRPRRRGILRPGRAAARRGSAAFVGEHQVIGDAGPRSSFAPGLPITGWRW